MGELGYIMPRWNEIQSALQMVGGVQLDNTNSTEYWSSNEFGNNGGARTLKAGVGEVLYMFKDYNKHVRPFCSIPLSLGF